MAAAGSPGAAVPVVPAAWLNPGGTEACPVAGCGVSCSVSKLLFHMRTHEPEELAAVRRPQPLGARPQGPFHCPELGCRFAVGGKVLKNVETARRHHKNTHAAPRYRCDVCAAAFVERHRLTAHVKAHAKLAVCRCGLRLPTPTALKKHVQAWRDTQSAALHGAAEVSLRGGARGWL